MSFLSPEWRNVLGPREADEVRAPILDCPNCNRLMALKSVRPRLMRREAAVAYVCANCGSVEMLTVKSGA